MGGGVTRNDERVHLGVCVRMNKRKRFERDRVGEREVEQVILESIHHSFLFAHGAVTLDDLYICESTSKKTKQVNRENVV